MKIFLVLFVSLAATALFFVAVQGLRRRASTIDRRTVARFDVPRYMGRWYEIARIENRFERGMTDVTADYRLLDDGTVEVVNGGRDPCTGQRREAVGRARLRSGAPGRLRVRFFGPFGADYCVLELDDDYRWALVGSRSEAYLWILSRTPTLDAPTCERLEAQARERGYDVGRLMWAGREAPRP
ncbi:MAG: lipocalin family protein [Alistipes sp.]|nr:lipocalin family protein [Alistipes sp.]